MRRPRPPLFLARAVYRKRRLRDAARLLPLLGMFLLLLPLIWSQSETGAAGQHWSYVFGVWALLIGLAAALSPGLAASDSEGGPDAFDRDIPDPDVAGLKAAGPGVVGPVVVGPGAVGPDAVGPER